MWWYTLYLLACGAYIVGSLPTGYIIASLAGVADIRKHGSGNIGATNVARVLGVSYFLPVFLLDVIKAAWYIFFVQHYYSDQTYVCCIALILLLGNSYSLFLSFTGGKGIATSIGILYALQPWLLCILLPVWASFLAVTTRVGIASAAACFSLVILALCFLTSCTSFLCVCMGLWGLWRHQENLKAYVSRV